MMFTNIILGIIVMSVLMSMLSILSLYNNIYSIVAVNVDADRSETFCQNLTYYIPAREKGPTEHNALLYII